MSVRSRTSLAASLAALALALLSPSSGAIAATSASLAGVSRGTTSGTWLTVPRPSSASGDVLVAAVAARLDAAVSITPPTGWTLIRRDANAPSSASLSQALYLHVATPTEPSSYAWKLGTAAVASVTVLDYRGVDPLAPVEATSGRFVASSKYLVAPSVTTAHAGDTLLALFANNSNRAIDSPAGTTERFDAAVQSAASTVASEGADAVVGAGATGDKAAVVAQGGPASSNIGQLVALRAAAGSTLPAPTPSPALSVATISPANGATVSGSIVWEASVAGSAARVEFLIDGVLKWTESAAPYVYNGDAGRLDTTTLAGGAHTLTARAVAADGSSATSSVSVDVSNAAAAQSTTTLYSASSPWNTAIAANATVDPGSGAMVQSLVSAAQAQGFLVAAKSWTVPVFYADSTTPRRTFALTASWAAARTMAGVPVPADARPDPSSDGHMLIIDRSTGCEYDFWKASQGANGSWSAAWGNALLTTGDGRYPFGLSARGSGFALGAGLILPGELDAGRINHALVFSYNTPRAGGPVWPATESDGTSTVGGAIPEGAHVQLDPSLNLDALGLTPWQKTIARALQVYGMFLGDHGGGISLYAQNAQSTSTTYPWGDQTYAYLPNSLVGHLRVLQLPPQFTPTYSIVATGCATMY